MKLFFLLHLNNTTSTYALLTCKEAKTEDRSQRRPAPRDPASAAPSLRGARPQTIGDRNARRAQTTASAADTWIQAANLKKLERGAAMRRAQIQIV